MARMPTKLREILQEQENDIDELLIKTKDKFYGVAQTNNDPSALSFMASVILLGFLVAYRDIFTSSNQKAVLAAGKLSKSELNSILNRANAKNAVLVSKFSKEVDNAVQKFKIASVLNRKTVIGKFTIDYNIKSIYDGSLKTVRNIVAVGVENGKSAINIAKEIEQFVRPTKPALSPLEWYRRRFTNYKVTTLNKIPPGSVSYNAYRIARTETARTYQKMTVDMNDGKPWVYGFKWNLSASHPVSDICNVWADKDYGMGPGIYEGSNLPDDHPSGLCYVTTVQVAPKDFKEYLDTGKEPYKPKFKGNVPDLDDWGKAKKGTSVNNAIRILK